MEILPKSHSFSISESLLFSTPTGTRPPSQRLGRDQPPDLVDNLPDSTAVAINATDDLFSPPTAHSSPHLHHRHPQAPPPPHAEPLPLPPPHQVPEVSMVSKEKNINVRAAIIHVFGDLIQSIGVLIAAYVIKYRVFTISRFSREMT